MLFVTKITKNHQNFCLSRPYTKLTDFLKANRPSDLICKQVEIHEAARD
jgi:hypothetical protein